MGRCKLQLLKEKVGSHTQDGSMKMSSQLTELEVIIICRCLIYTESDTFHDQLRSY